jgi:hypothetical protein
MAKKPFEKSSADRKSDKGMKEGSKSDMARDKKMSGKGKGKKGC